MHSVALYTCFTEPTTKICMKIDPHYQRQKCSPGILVSSKVSLCGYSQGFAGEGASNDSEVVEIGDFASFARRLSEKTVRKICGATHILSATKM